jgi:exoribonuclease-2
MLMIPLKSLVAYKGRPALVLEGGEKIRIVLWTGESKLREPASHELWVREKDVEFLHPGPVGDLSELAEGGAAEKADSENIRGAWELLEGMSVSLKELAELVYGAYTAETAWAAYGLLREGLYFSGSPEAVTGRGAADLAGEEQKRALKRRDAAERDAFLERLKGCRGDIPEAGGLPADEPEFRRFIQDVEALAWGRTDKSRTLKDLGKPETPQEAHRLLLSAGFWTPRINPHPLRFGLSLSSARIPLDAPPPGEDRLDLTGLAAFAIDNAWSADPDDALSLEGNCLWVHVADPAAALPPGSPADLEARGRGATLYLPEGSFRMLSEEALPRYALGLGETSPALSFKIELRDDGSIAETGVFPSLVRVTRMTYGEADALMSRTGAGEAAGGEQSAGEQSAGAGQAGNAAILAGLLKIAERNLARRLAAGGVSIELPETHIAVSGEKIEIEPIPPSRAADMVRECMLLAGEGAAGWALQRRLAFPYVNQEAGDLPAKPLPGMAGSYQLRRCMRPRTLSVKPAAHWGLGLAEYTQVTSPLRRYTDLLAHQQIRAFLRGEPPLGEEELLPRLAAGEAAAVAGVQAERASRAHWTAVYLLDKKGSEWKGVVMEKKGGRAVFIIPALGLETQAAVKEEPEPNQELTLSLGTVKIPEAEAVFVIP